MIGYIIFAIFLCVIITVPSAWWFYCAMSDGNRISTALAAVVGTVVLTAAIAAFNWYPHNTESGKRMIKSWESETSGGIERTIAVYDITGKLLKTYEGKFDVQYESDRLVFDDEDGKRHIIYYAVSTVFIDEK